MTNTPPRHDLRYLVNRNVEEQNGFGYDDFTKVATVLLTQPPGKRPTVTSCAKLFNRNIRTFQGWLQRYEEEIK